MPLLGEDIIRRFAKAVEQSQLIMQRTGLNEGRNGPVAVVVVGELALEFHACGKVSGWGRLTLGKALNQGPVCRPPKSLK